jgi:3-phenylpropionate/trans-cinnamate dioxygenase ferredoxin subunit
MTSHPTRPFIKVAHIDELPVGKMVRFELQQRPAVLVNLGGAFHAFADYCMHWGVRLSDGCLQGQVVRCKAHGWNHDIVRGEASDPRGGEAMRMFTFETRVDDGHVWVCTVGKNADPGS